MALPGLGLIPPPYQFDADGNILPTSLMRRASLTGNVIGRIVRASRAAFDAPVDDEDTAVLAYYGPDGRCPKLNRFALVGLARAMLARTAVVVLTGRGGRAEC